MARGKKHAGGRPALPAGAKKEKVQVMLNPAQMAELKRRNAETGAPLAEMVRRAVKLWLVSTKAVGFDVDPETYRKLTEKKEGK